MIASVCTETCTYWQGAPDGYGGRVYGAPQQLKCRWEQKQRLIRTKTGEERVSVARVFLLQSVDLEGRLYRGATAEPDPRLLDSHELQAGEELQQMDGTVAGWVVWL
jgi:hypothetical protein